MAIFFYNFLLVILFPVVLLIYGYRVARGKESAPHLAERCGRYGPEIARDPRRPRIWVHAVSVGEVMAATPVLRDLRRRYPDAFLILSVTTTGGREVAQGKIPPADHVVYFPLDFPFAVHAAVRAVRPDLLILMEWEIWPNLLSAAGRHGATIAVVNGRVSDKGLRRGTRVRWFLAAALRYVDVFAMQSDEDSRRAVIVGANPDAVHTVGNTKFDESSAMLTPSERAELRREFGIPEGVPVWICGSTRNAPDDGGPDEEEALYQAFTMLRERIPNLVLIIAPRHLERTGTVEKCFVRGFAVRKRSSGATAPGVQGQAPVVLLDTFGELGRAYALADVAFVGGSLVRQGGQSVFQPLAQGIPAIFGPHMNNQRDIAALSLSEGCGFMVENAAELADTVHRILRMSREEKSALADRARALIDRNQGVTARALDLIEAARAKGGSV